MESPSDYKMKINAADEVNKNCYLSSPPIDKNGDED